MPHNVPSFQFTENALALRAYNYEHWCTHGRGPTLADAHAALGINRWALISAYKELQLGLICVIDADTQNCNVTKFQPFSAFASQVKGFVDGEFHSYVGCAMEAMAFHKMPPFANRDVRIESWCACCFEPVTATFRNGELQQARPGEPLIHVSRSPHGWANVDITSMCDAMNFVIDADHARRYEAQIGGAGVLFTLQQATWFTSATAAERMHNHHWEPGRIIPEAVIKIIAKLGVDTAPWGYSPAASTKG